ncbi:hypothetical protein [Sedimentitalea nanhaiensis]|uniref:Uncharacterized protein n=1 Tax=Sedimentitalea nanhaiensis TaxID=999627 RepID=A0A1I7ECV3_9RHOB|nr:hypothetical protein [Sedimentitalea nanhaiensis]SFU21786.1 hypothetical protein SAMN05216236_1707 [Sedimentitalea nanhaiensis]
MTKREETKAAKVQAMLRRPSGATHVVDVTADGAVRPILTSLSFRQTTGTYAEQS